MLKKSRLELFTRSTVGELSQEEINEVNGGSVFYERQPFYFSDLLQTFKQRLLEKLNQPMSRTEALRILYYAYGLRQW